MNIVIGLSNASTRLRLRLDKKCLVTLKEKYELASNRPMNAESYITHSAMANGGISVMIGCTKEGRKLLTVQPFQLLRYSVDTGPLVLL